MDARIFLLADSDPPGHGEALVVSTALGANPTAVQSMLAEETCATCLTLLQVRRRLTHSLKNHEPRLIGGDYLTHAPSLHAGIVEPRRRDNVLEGRTIANTAVIVIGHLRDAVLRKE